MKRNESDFVWDMVREIKNVHKHGIDFTTAVKAFNDPVRKIYVDSIHSDKEQRFFCIGKVEGRILTVRFTYREGKIRIFGAGQWRKGIRYYEKRY